MIADPEINALWVCSPNFARIETFEEIANAIKCVENGKKPPNTIDRKIGY